MILKNFRFSGKRKKLFVLTTTYIKIEVHEEYIYMRAKITNEERYEGKSRKKNKGI